MQPLLQTWIPAREMTLLGPTVLILWESISQMQYCCHEQRQEDLIPPEVSPAVLVGFKVTIASSKQR